MTRLAVFAFVLAACTSATSSEEVTRDSQVGGTSQTPESLPSPRVEEVRSLFEEAHFPRSSVAGSEAFLHAFARADWTRFDPVSDEKLLRTGCYRVAVAALHSGDAPTAVRAMEFYEAKYPEDGRGAVSHLLPVALALAGDPTRAERRLDEFVRHPDPGVAGWACVHLGDLRLLRGDLDAARAAWSQTASVPAPARSGGDLRQAQEAAVHRLRSVGQPVPSLEVEGGGVSEWVVGGPLAADALRGRVAVVLPFETSCGQCRQMLHALQRLHEDRAAHGLLVIGLLRPQSEGRLPRPGARDLWSGAELVTVPPGGMRDHTAAFAANCGLTFPIGLVSVRTWSRWCLLGWHPLLVVGPEGRVEFLTAGGDTLGLVRVTVDRLLAAQPK